MSDANTAQPQVGASTATVFHGMTIMDHLKSTARDMSGWLKFLGIVYIVMGIPTLIVLIGGLYIWIGILLFQAGQAAAKRDELELDVMLRRLKTYFIIQGVLMVIGIGFMILWLLFVGFAVFTGLSGGSETGLYSI